MLFSWRFATKDGGERRILVTCEAKQTRERILEQQIIEQISAAFDTSRVYGVVAVGLRAIKSVGLYFVEFEEVTKANFNRQSPLRPVSEIVYVLKPSLK